LRWVCSRCSLRRLSAADNPRKHLLAAITKSERVGKVAGLPSGPWELYVNSKTLPAGPFLAYHHQGKLVSTIYMIPLKDIQAEKKFDNLAAPGGSVDHISLYYNAGHPGVPDPHHHIVLWHVSKAQEQLVAN
jgi:hypothetical protein